jgi:hypothetical protein
MWKRQGAGHNRPSCNSYSTWLHTHGALLQYDCAGIATLHSSATNSFCTDMLTVTGDRGSTVVKVLSHKSEGRWFDPRCHGIFHWHKSFWSHYFPGVDSASNRNEYREYFLGGKCVRCVRLTTLPPSCAVVKISGNLSSMEPSGPPQACNGTALPYIDCHHLQAGINQEYIYNTRTFLTPSKHWVCSVLYRTDVVWHKLVAECENHRNNYKWRPTRRNYCWLIYF